MKYGYIFLSACFGWFSSAAQVSTVNAQRRNNLLYNVMDKNTGTVFSFTKVDKYLDGTQMNNSKCDDVIYIKYKNEFFKRNYEGPLNVKWFGCNENSSDNQVIINKVLRTYKTAYIPEGEYTFSATIIVPENASLCGAGRASVLKLISPKPIDGISLFRRATLKDLKLDCTKTDLDTSAAVLVNDWDSVESLLGELRVQNVFIQGNYPHLQGVGLKLSVKTNITQKYSVIVFCKFYDIDIYGFRDGIYCSLEYKKGKNISYINANIFEKIIIHRCLRPVRLINTADKNDVVSGKGAISSNFFQNIIIQHVTGDFPAIFMDGATNNKVDAHIIDWKGYNAESTNKSARNVFNVVPGDAGKIKTAN